MQVQYGENFRTLLMQDFQQYVPINNGACGTCPKSIYDIKLKYQREFYSIPEKWILETQFNVLKEQTKHAAEFIGGKPEQTVLMESATAGFTSIFNGMAIYSQILALNLSKGDKILTTNIPYYCLIEQVKYMVQKDGLINIQVQLNTESLQTNEGILKQFQKSVEEHPDIKVCVFDHISSNPTLIFPAKEITKFLKSKGIIVIIDGVQAVGQIELNVEDIDADFYLVNFYKWVFCPVGASGLWMAEKYLNIINPPFISNFQGNSDFYKRFYWQGMRDASSMCCVKEGINFFQSINPIEARKYGHNLVIAGAKKIAQMLGTDLLIKNDEMIPCMCCFEVPESIEIMEKVQQKLLSEGRCLMYCVKFDGKVVMRICGWVHNEIQDYEKFADLFIQEIKNQKQKQ